MLLKKICCCLGLSLLLIAPATAQYGSKILNPSELVFKVHNNPAQDQTDQFDIQGMGGSSFTVSNTADGSANSYKHALNVVLSLIPVNKTGYSSFELNFYSPGENIQQAANYKDGVLHIYYPVSLYTDIRTRLEQAFAARKKVTVKVVQKPTGYREGSLQF